MGAGIQECDVTFTKDKKLVCRHSQCDLHTTTNVVAIPELNAKCTTPFKPAVKGSAAATAKCCTSDFTLDEIKKLCAKMDTSNPDAATPAEYLTGTPGYRTDLYAKTSCSRINTLREYIDLVDGLGLKFTSELKTPEVPMPFPAGSDFTQARFAQQMIDEFKAAGVKPERVWLQSFLYDDLLYWIKAEPQWARQAIFLDESADEAGTMPQAVANLEVRASRRQDHRASAAVPCHGRKRKDCPERVRHHSQEGRPEDHHLDSGAQRLAGRRIGRRILLHQRRERHQQRGRCVQPAARAGTGCGRHWCLFRLECHRHVLCQLLRSLLNAGVGVYRAGSKYGEPQGLSIYT